MQIKHKTILTFLFIFSISSLFAQDRLSSSMVPDSLIRRLKIKRVTEHWFTDSLQNSPANTTMEWYDELGNRTKRIHINYFYHKFVDSYQYIWNKNIIVKTEYYFDWNPYREKNKGDTIRKKSVSKYYIDSRRPLNTKPSRLEAFQPILIFDDLGRLSKRTDSIKFGFEITCYSYENNGNLNGRKHYICRNDEEPYLYAVDSLHFDLNGRLSKETNYYDVQENGDGMIYDREIISTYTYTTEGLLFQKNRVERYRSLTDRKFKPAVYRYEYEFY